MYWFALHCHTNSLETYANRKCPLCQGNLLRVECSPTDLQIMVREFKARTHASTPNALNILVLDAFNSHQGNVVRVGRAPSALNIMVFDEKRFQMQPTCNKYMVLDALPHKNTANVHKCKLPPSARVTCREFNVIQTS